MNTDAAAATAAAADRDNLSNCTAATTASLASRLASLAVHYPATRTGADGGGPADEDDDGSASSSASSSSSEGGTAPSGEEDEDVEVVELTEDQVLGVLDGLEPAWAVAGRLFKPRPYDTPPALRVLTWAALDALRTRGYAVIDDLLTPAQATELRGCVLGAREAGALADAASVAAGAAYRAAPGARSDATAWLPGADPAAPPAHAALDTPAMVTARRVLADVAADVGAAVRLALPPGACGEVQVALYPPGGRYVRHRDALPDDGGCGEDGGGGDGQGDAGLGQRRVTVVLYANPGWEPESGGKLRLWPPVGPGEEEEEEEGEEQGLAPLAPSARRPPAVGGPSSVVAEPTEAAASDAATEAPTSVAGWGGGGGGTPRGGGPPSNARPVATPPDVRPASPRPPSVTIVSPGRGTEMGPEAAVDVAPLAGRAVLFMSGVVEHAVLAAGADRVAITGWLR